MSERHQEAIAQIVEHIFTQPFQAKDYVGIGNGCCFLNAKGHQCHVGVLLTPEEAAFGDKNSMEGFELAQELAEKNPGEHSLADLGPVFLEEVQDIHDFLPLREWAGKYRELATTYSCSEQVMARIDQLEQFLIGSKAA